jgi:deazaflavin-dependent oxidoreductase (nitroreductase family)
MARRLSRPAAEVQDSVSYSQKQSRNFVYPKRGWRRLFFESPLYLWRMGLEPLLRHLRFIVLTTHGRKSGGPRRVMLEHSYRNGRVYIAPGWGERTQWYLNIRANPRVTVQRNGKTLAAMAQLVTDDTELAELYHLARKNSPVWKQYLTSRGVEDTLEDFLAKRDRVPALRLDPVAGDPPLHRCGATCGGCGLFLH